MQHDFRDSLSTGLQQRTEPFDSRQQQQDNGTHEFQPRQQAGGMPAHEDAQHTLSAYLERSRQRGELPRPRLADAIARPRPRPALRLAK